MGPELCYISRAPLFIMHLPSPSLSVFNKWRPKTLLAPCFTSFLTYYSKDLADCVLEVDGNADPGGRAVCDVILRPVHRWDRGYESRWGHGWSFAVFVLCRVGSGLYDELITRKEESYRVCVCVCVCVCLCVSNCVCDVQILTAGRPSPKCGFCTTTGGWEGRLLVLQPLIDTMPRAGQTYINRSKSY
jgi:hypothetical protein